MARAGLASTAQEGETARRVPPAGQLFFLPLILLGELTSPPQTSSGPAAGRLGQVPEYWSPRFLPPGGKWWLWILCSGPLDER